jgi:hypothetical protein
MGALKLSRGIRLYLMLPQAVECRAGQVAVVPGQRLVDALAGPQVHVALANVNDDDKAVGKFVRDWGPLRASKDYSMMAAAADEMLDLPMNEAAKALRAAHPQAATFFVHPRSVLVGHRDMLRRAWQGDRAAIEPLQQDVSANASTWAFNKDRIEIGVPDAWTAACILLLHDRAGHKAGICEWPDCPAPYFHRPRFDQKFCGGDCTAESRKKIKRDWYRENRGKQ